MHPVEHADWVLLDFSDPKYQYAWALHVRNSLAAGGWTGVDVIDADNDPDWSDTPIDPATGEPMTEAHRRRYLAQALTLVRAALKIQGYSLLADNGPPAIVELRPGQQHRRGQPPRRVRPPLPGTRGTPSCASTPHVAGWESGTYVADRPGLSRAQMLYGLASFLLVAIPRDSAYVAPTSADSPLYAIQPGTAPTTPPTDAGGGVDARRTRTRPSRSIRRTSRRRSPWARPGVSRSARGRPRSSPAGTCSRSG